MDLRKAVRIWRARWILTSVLLILAIVGAGWAAGKMPRYYQSASSVVLLASRAASTQNGGNPFLSFSPSLTLTADALSRELMAPGTVEKLAARGFTATYTVAPPPYTTSTTGSVLLVTVTGPDAARVQGTLRAVTMQIGTQLAQLQHGVPPRGQAHAATLSFTPQATLSISQTARPLAAAGALLLVICLGTPIVVDGLIARRRLRRRSALPDDWALSQDWVSLDIPAVPPRPASPGEPTIPGMPALPGEPAMPGGATGSTDEQADGDPAQGERWLPRPPDRSSAIAARNTRHPGPTGKRAGLGDVSRS